MTKEELNEQDVVVREKNITLGKNVYPIGDKAITLDETEINVVFKDYMGYDEIIRIDILSNIDAIVTQEFVNYSKTSVSEIRKIMSSYLMNCDEVIEKLYEI